MERFTSLGYFYFSTDDNSIVFMALWPLYNPGRKRDVIVLFLSYCMNILIVVPSISLVVLAIPDTAYHRGIPEGAKKKFRTA